MFTRIKRLFLGQPLSTQMLTETEKGRLSKRSGLAILSSDALSSVAYATEEILLPLSLLSFAAMGYSLPIALAIATVMTIVMISYRQIFQAYPAGGGAYRVAKENLGIPAGLLAAAALLVDYVLTVAVSVSAAVAALVSAFPGLSAYHDGVALTLIGGLTFLNLRGFKRNSRWLAVPTYAFLGSLLLLFAVGGWKVLTGQVAPAAPIWLTEYPEIAWFALLRAFSSGCVALTGIESISNGVQLFRGNSVRSAKTTIRWMAIILVASFLGVTALAHVLGVGPTVEHTVLSQLSLIIFGQHAFFYFFQVSTALILFFAASTAYRGFPHLASMLARDQYMPRQLASLGDKGVFSYGIIGLSVTAMALLVWFDVSTHHLIALYAVGVFLSFTLAQSGMVVFHLRQRKLSPHSSRFGLVINFLGALTTGVVLIVVAASKFAMGAWMVLLGIPVAILIFLWIREHYENFAESLSLPSELSKQPLRFEKVKHTVVIPVSGIHRGVIDAVRYGVSISEDVRACYVEINPADTAELSAKWNRLMPTIPFVVLHSPYRSVVRPLLEYINDIEQTCGDDLVTVLLPEFVPAHWFEGLLHNQTALMIKASLMFKRRRIVTSIKYHLRS